MNTKEYVTALGKLLKEANPKVQNIVYSVNENETEKGENIAGLMIDKGDNSYSFTYVIGLDKWQITKKIIESIDDPEEEKNDYA